MSVLKKKKKNSWKKDLHTYRHFMNFKFIILIDIEYESDNFIKKISSPSRLIDRERMGDRECDAGLECVIRGVYHPPSSINSVARRHRRHRR